jgi:acetyl-CoA/propionyl-CoA carboxylase biotin carboxyl carrier protein
VSTFVPPLGPGVRVDTGISSGDVIGGAFDSLLAKLIVTGATREQALERSARALDEMQVDGMATLLPFHRKVVKDPAFTSEPFTVHNRWIETEFDNDIPPFTGGADGDDDAGPRETVVVEVGGPPASRSRCPRGSVRRRGGGGGGGGKKVAKRKASAAGAGAGASGDTLASPMQGTVVKVAVEDGATVAEGDLVVVIEAMKMEQPLTAHKAGTVSGLTVGVGEVLTSGAAICEITD